ncbi:hypothetical protein ACFWPK_24080 [Nocardia sp. NPDC058519]|uniref:hypothetical protein n=1 Tax=Nocardia sp. NPDC058519 TaxID=3346535 RepID=UPI003646B03C
MASGSGEAMSGSTFGRVGFLVTAATFPAATLYALSSHHPPVPGPIWFAVGVVLWLVALAIRGIPRQVAIGMLVGATGLLIRQLLYPSILVLAFAIPAAVVCAVVSAVRRGRRGRRAEETGASTAG